MCNTNTNDLERKCTKERNQRNSTLFVQTILFKGSFFTEENSSWEEWRDGINTVISELEKENVCAQPSIPLLAQRYDQLHLNYSQNDSYLFFRNIQSSPAIYLSAHSLCHFLQRLFYLSIELKSSLLHLKQVTCFLHSMQEGQAVPHVLATAFHLQVARYSPLLTHVISSTLLTYLQLHLS